MWAQPQYPQICIMSSTACLHCMSALQLYRSCPCPDGKVQWPPKHATGAEYTMAHVLSSRLHACQVISNRRSNPAAQVHISRVVIISEVDKGHCRHTITGDVRVRVPGVCAARGGLL